MGTRSVARGRALFGAAVMALAAAAGCKPVTEVHVPLDYRPTDQLVLTGLSIPQGLRLAVTAADARTETGSIGSNTEHQTPVPVYAAGRTPDEFLRDGVARELAKAGITIAESPREANRGLHLRLLRFWTEESSQYRATVMADVELKDGSGRLWQGQASGSNERWGRSLSPDNYQEVFSDATVNLVQNLLANPAFVRALEQEPARPRPAKRRS